VAPRRDARDDNGRTPLHWSIDMAQAWGEPERVVSLLLKAGASPNAVDDAGFTVLMTACGRSNEAILDQLIAAGADVHLRSAETSALHEAAHCNFVPGIERLLALGADPHQTDAWGLTPEQDAAGCGFDESVAAFRAARPRHSGPMQ
jgi:ankyrin repeat protein